MIQIQEYRNPFSNKYDILLVDYIKGMKLSDVCVFDTETFTYFVDGKKVERDLLMEDNQNVIKKVSLKGKSLNKVLGIVLAVVVQNDH